ncbi:unnamed protein product [Mytilus coruscus]|uniref:THAP-type domain-containing protein n=1 Tax=Mytilus coruscus TaxID=42192 RepID=A0A6J8BKE8_MYTCO|nr:unnamed protein product [Mytilus coruscus]
MVASCCVIGCTNRFDKENPKSFYRIPKKPESRKKLWISAIRRDQWEPRENDRVCFRHFISGVKSKYENNPDYVPSVDMGYQKYKASGDQRYARFFQKSGAKTSRQKRKSKWLFFFQYCLTLVMQRISQNLNSVQSDNNQQDACINKIATLKIENEQLYAELGRLQTENTTLKANISQLNFENLVTASDRKIQFYTGVHSKALFMWLLSFCSCILPSCKVMSPTSVLLCLLMKLRLNLQHEDLAYRFGVSKTTISDILNLGLPKLASKLSFLIQWPDTE